MFRKAFRYRLYPNEEQQSGLTVQFGHARFVFNWALATRDAYYKEHEKNLGYYALKRMMTELKRQPDHAWLKEADSQALQAKVEDLDRAFTNYFKKRAGHPRFKRRHSHQSIRYPQRFKFDDNHVYLPKVGWVKIVLHRPLEGKPKSLTVSKTKSGEYYASVLCEVEVTVQPNGKPSVGVDLGLKDFAVLSTGEKVEHPKYLKHAERRLKKLQKRLSRKKKGGANRNKARLLVARQHEHVARQRADFLHKLSRRLVAEHGAIHLEDLNIPGMLANHRLAKSIADSGWGMFGRFCEYKADWYGSQVVRADRFYPSSKTCGVCGCINHDLTLSDRFWTCENCGAHHDRDINAAVNLLHETTVGATESLRMGRGRKTYLPVGKTHASQNHEAQLL